MAFVAMFSQRNTSQPHGGEKKSKIKDINKTHPLKDP